MANIWEERKKGLEEEYFRRKEQEALEKTRQRLQVDSDHKQLCFMCCPKCCQKLEEVVFKDVKVDRCNSCHGVWLDPGELERLTSKESRGWLARFWRSTPQ